MNRVRTLACLLIGLTLAVSARGGFLDPIVRAHVSQTRPANDGALGAEVQQQLRTIASNGLSKAGAPGMSVAVTFEGAHWSDGFGLADVENEVRVTPDTVFRIASITKPIAATAVMQLVERGRVSLDDPVQKHVPVFPAKGEQVVTIRHVLSHTSGIRHYKEGEFNHKESYDSVNAALAIFKDDPLLFKPGTKYSYSTYAYNLLAGVVERASGVTFEQYLSEHVFKPAGMTRTYLEHPEQIVVRRARPYIRASGARVLNAPYADLSVKWAGGGIISTVGDLIKFHSALADGRLLERKTQELMYTPMALADGSKSTYGLGWMITEATGVGRWIAHSGGATGGTTYLLRHPECRKAVAILTNVQDAPGLRDLAVELAAELPACGVGGG